MLSLPPDTPVLFFDGVCNLCNGWVQFLIKRDKQQRFRFASLQSPIGQQLLTEAHRGPGDMQETVILYYQGRYYTRSAAVLKIFGLLGGLWPLLCAGYIIPAFLRNALYDGIARNRYKWFGKKGVCMVPTPEQKHRFIE